MALAARESEPARERARRREQERERELSELGHAFRRVWRSLGSLRGRDTHLGGAELSHAQFELLLELCEHGELSAGELASTARMAPGTVTQMLEHLALSGHVERSRSDSDRRVVLSRLTPQGQQRIEAKRAAWKERWEQALADLDNGQLQAATEVLQRLGAMFAERAASACSEGPDQTLENAAAARLESDSALL